MHKVPILKDFLYSLFALLFIYSHLSFTFHQTFWTRWHFLRSGYYWLFGLQHARELYIICFLVIIFVKEGYFRQKAEALDFSCVFSFLCSVSRSLRERILFEQSKVLTLFLLLLFLWSKLQGNHGIYDAYYMLAYQWIPTISCEREMTWWIPQSFSPASILASPSFCLSPSIRWRSWW